MESKYAIIENKSVKNIVICSEKEAKKNKWVLAENAKIGDTYENGVFSRGDSEKFESWEIVRIIRNQLLDSTDWVVVFSLERKDSLSNEWKTYRQELRDITKTFSSPQDVVFPNQPSS